MSKIRLQVLCLPMLSAIAGFSVWRACHLWEADREYRCSRGPGSALSDTSTQKREEALIAIGGERLATEKAIATAVRALREGAPMVGPLFTFRESERYRPVPKSSPIVVGRAAATWVHLRVLDGNQWYVTVGLKETGEISEVMIRCP